MLLCRQMFHHLAGKSKPNPNGLRGTDKKPVIKPFAVAQPMTVTVKNRTWNNHYLNCERIRFPGEDQMRKRFGNTFVSWCEITDRIGNGYHCHACLLRGTERDTNSFSLFEAVVDH